MGWNIPNISMFGIRNLVFWGLEIHEFFMILKKNTVVPLEDIRKQTHFLKSDKWKDTSIYPVFPVKSEFQVKEMVNSQVSLCRMPANKCRRNNRIRVSHFYNPKWNKRSRQGSQITTCNFLNGCIRMKTPVHSDQYL